jgi:hypothetical protein
MTWRVWQADVTLAGVAASLSWYDQWSPSCNVVDVADVQERNTPPDKSLISPLDNAWLIGRENYEIRSRNVRIKIAEVRPLVEGYNLCFIVPYR